MASFQFGERSRLNIIAALTYWDRRVICDHGANPPELRVLRDECPGAGPYDSADIEQLIATLNDEAETAEVVALD